MVIENTLYNQLFACGSEAVRGAALNLLMGEDTQRRGIVV